MRLTTPVILLVDDDDGHLMVAKRAISRSDLGVQVRVARTGAEALKILGLDKGTEAQDLGPTVVMLDLSMPGISGWDVLKRIREAHEGAHTPVVVVSSSGRPDDVQRSYDLGANSYVVKRYDSDRPGGYLVDTLRYWLELNEPPAGSIVF